MGSQFAKKKFLRIGTLSHKRDFIKNACVSRRQFPVSNASQYVFQRSVQENYGSSENVEDFGALSALPLGVRVVLVGIVYMAEQEQPIRRRVALKIIKPGMDSGQVIARFEAERQTLVLRAYDEAGSSLDPPPGAFPPTSGYAPVERPGAVIGPYKLLQQIGEGGH
jgi:hypothetical protein